MSPTAPTAANGNDNALAKVGLNWRHRASRRLTRRTRQLHLRLASATVEGVEQAAATDGLTVNGWVEQTLLAELLARANRRIQYGNIQADLASAEQPRDGTPP
jgi:hypothetical protein